MSQAIFSVCDRLSISSTQPGSSYSCAYHNGSGFHAWARVQTFKKAETSVSKLKVVSPYRVSK